MKENKDRPQQEKAKEDAEVAYNEKGVDLTLIRWMLSLTPTERLLQLQAALESVLVFQGKLHAKD